MALRDIVKIGSRVLGAAGGFVATGFNPMGAMAGYGLGATVGDLAAGQPETRNEKSVSISDYDPRSGFEKNPTSRVNKFSQQVTDLGWSDKVAGIADPLVAASANLYGQVGKGKLSSIASKKWKLKGGSNATANDLSDVSSTLDETNDMMAAGNKIVSNINQRRLSAGLLPINATGSGQTNIPYLLNPQVNSSSDEYFNSLISKRYNNGNF